MCKTSTTANDVAEVFRQYKNKLTHINKECWDVVNDIINCRTKILGGHKSQCNNCGHVSFFYNSCRNRHCPKCGSLAKARWIENRMDELLPVQYFHIVFTIPSLLNHITLTNKKVIYNILFKTVKETLLEAAKNPKNLGANVGFISILHTWGQNLFDHPHLHCIVPGGGLNDNEDRWIHSPKDFFIHVKILSKLFKGKFLFYLKKAYKKNSLCFYGESEKLRSELFWKSLLNDCYRKKWVVYSKKPFSGPEQVVKYLGRYTHKIAISNHRIHSIKNGNVTFWWKDYRQNNQKKLMTLTAEEFMRRFLLHVLPKRFVRMRFYGFLSNNKKTNALVKCREFLHEIKSLEKNDDKESWQALLFRMTGIDVDKCPACKSGKMLVVEIITPFDTS